MAVEITSARLRRAVLALSRVTGEKHFVAVGRATLGVTAPRPLRNLAMSDDIDLFSIDDERAGLDESRSELGEGSAFHENNGYYIERVGKCTLYTQPTGWENRAITKTFGDVTVLVLGTLDLAYNKLEADREKDREFFREALKRGLFTIDELRTFIENHALSEERRKFLLSKLSALSTD
jgi:hypothetical protein